MLISICHSYGVIGEKTEFYAPCFVRIDPHHVPRRSPVKKSVRQMFHKISCVPPIARRILKCAEIGASKVGFSAITGLNRQYRRNRRTRLRAHAFMKASLMEAMTWRTTRTPTSNAATALADVAFLSRSSSSLQCLSVLQSLVAIRRKSIRPGPVPHLNRHLQLSTAQQHLCQPNNTTHTTHDLTDGRFFAPVFLRFSSVYRSLPCCF